MDFGGLVLVIILLAGVCGFAKSAKCFCCDREPEQSRNSTIGKKGFERK